MITPTPYCISESLVRDGTSSLPTIDSRLAINRPTGRFFYDPWEIKPEFKNTVWETILLSLNGPIGEARLISLEPGICYRSHADIDDRWHLTLVGEQSFLIDLDNQLMHSITEIGRWYSMDTSICHSAANFGSYSRVQLVVRQLLTDCTLKDPVVISIAENKFDSRYQFDNLISPWLNKRCKERFINNVTVTESSITLSVEKQYADELTTLLASIGLNAIYEH